MKLREIKAIADAFAAVYGFDAEAEISLARPHRINKKVQSVWVDGDMFFERERLKRGNGAVTIMFECDTARPVVVDVAPDVGHVRGQGL